MLKILICVRTKRRVKTHMVVIVATAVNVVKISSTKSVKVNRERITSRLPLLLHRTVCIFVFLLLKSLGINLMICLSHGIVNSDCEEVI